MILKKWWAPIISVPMISFLILIALYSFLYPFLSHGNWGFIVSPRDTIVAIVFLAAVLIPIISSKLHKLPILMPMVMWLLVTVLGMFLEKGGYEGNQNFGLAGYFAGFQIGAMVIVTTFYCYLLKSK